MERLLVDREDRHPGPLEQRRIIQRPDLQDNKIRQIRPFCESMRSAFAAELSRHRHLQVIAPKPFRPSRQISESGLRHEHEEIGRTSRYVLALPAMALRFQHGFAFGLIAQRPAITPTLEFQSTFLLRFPLHGHDLRRDRFDWLVSKMTFFR